MLKFIVTISSLFILCSCATLNKEECQNANWNNIGYSDGTTGYPASRLNDHIKACSEHGISVNTQQYSNEYEKGLKKYCDHEKALERGLRGESYNNVCGAKFEKKYFLGKKIYDTKTRISDIEKSIENKYRQLEVVKDTTQRNSLNRDIRKLKRERRGLEKQLSLYHLKAGNALDAIINIM